MRRLFFFLSLLLCLLCTACTPHEASEEPSSPPSTEQPPTPSSQSEHNALSLALLDGTQFDFLRTASNLQVTQLSSADAAGDALNTGKIDCAILPLDAAVTLFQKDGDMQVVALFTPKEVGEAQSLDCLMARRAVLQEQASAVQDLLTSCTGSTADTLLCSTGWDMADQIQTYCEIQSAQAPELGISIPDNTFYYFAS